MPGIELASAFVRIRPQLAGFRTDLETQVKADVAEVSRTAGIRPHLDMGHFREQLRVEMAGSSREFLVKPKLDMAGFREEVRAKTSAAGGEFLVKPKLDMAGFREEVRLKTAAAGGEFLVKPKLDMIGFREEVRAKTALSTGEFLVKPKLDMAGFRQEVRAKTAAAGGEFLVRPHLDMAGFREEVRAKTAVAGGEFLVKPKLNMAGFREEVRLKTAAARSEFLVKPKLDMAGFREEVRAKTSAAGGEFLVKPRLDMAGFRERLTAAVMRASAGVEAVIRVTADTAPAKRKVAEVTAETRALGAETGVLGRVGAESYSLLGEHAGKFGRYLQVARLGVAGLGLAFAGAVYEGVKMSADYTREMTKVQSLTDSSGENFKKIRVDVLNLSGATARAPKELADALYFIESGGLRGSRAMDALTMTARAAATGLGNTKDVAQLLVGSMNAYSSTGLTAKAATDMLVAGVTEGHMPVDELARSLGRVQGVAAALHVSFPQVVANIAAMTKTGMSSSQAATSLQSVITALGRMDAPSTKVAGAMKDIGITSAGLRKELQEKGLNAALNDIANRTQAWSKANGGSNAALLNLFPNVRALRDITGTSIAQQEAYNHVLNRVEHATDGVGRANEAFAITQRTLPFRIREVTNAIRVDLIKFGDAMAPVINRIFDWAASVGPGVMRFFRNLKEGFQAFLPILGPFVTAFLTPLVAGFTLAAKGAGLFAAALAPVGRWLSQYRGWFEPILVMAGTYVGVMTGWIVVTKAWAVATDIAKAAQLAFNTVVKANPIMMVVAAIAALAVGIKYAYDHFKPFHDAWDRGWKQISGVIVALAPVWDHIVGAFEHGWKQISDALGHIGDAFHTLWSALTGGKAARDEILGFFSRLPGDIGKALGQAGGAIADFGKRIPGWIGDGLKSAGSLLVDAGRHVLGWLWDGVKAALSLLDVGGKLLHAVSDGLQHGSDIVYNAGKKLPGWLVRGISSAAGDIVDFFTHFFDHLFDGGGGKGGGGGVGGSGKKAGKSLISSIIDGMKGAVGGLIDFVTSLPKILSDWAGRQDWGKIGSKIVSGIGAFLKDLKNVAIIAGVIVGALAAAGAIVVLAVPAIIGLIGFALVDALWHAVEKNWPKVTAAFDRGLHQITGVLDRGWQRITGAFEHGWHQITGVVSRIWQDVSSAFERGWHQISDLASRLWRDITGAFERGSKQIERVLAPFVDFFQRHWRAILSIATFGVGAIYVVIQDHWSKIVTAFERGWHQITGFATRMWNDVTGAFDRGGRQTSGVVTRLWHDVSSAFERGWHQISDTVSRLWIDVSGAFTRGWHQITDLVTRLWRDVSSAFERGWHQIADLTSRLWRDISDAFTRGWHQIADLVARLWRDISDAFTRGWHQISDLVTRLWRDVSDAFTRGWHQITDLVTRLWRDVSDAFTRGWHQIADLVTRLWHDVVNFVHQMGADVWGIIGPFVLQIIGAFQNLWQSASRIVTSLWHDVSSFFGRMRDDVVGIFDDLVTKVGHIWDRVKEAVATPIRWVIETPYDKGIVPLIHGIGDILHEPGMQNLQALHFDRGGMVPGNHNQDTVPLYGTPGEVMVDKPTVARHGGPQALMGALGMSGGGGPLHYAVGGPLVPAGFNLSGANLSGLSGLSSTLSNVAHAAPGVAAARQFVTAADAKRIASTNAGGGGVLDTIGRGISRLGHDIVHPTDLLADLKKLALGALATVAAPAIHGLESAADGALKGMGEPGRWMGKEVHNIGDALLALIQGKDDAYNAAQAAAAAAAAGGGGGGFIGQVGNGTDIVNQARKYLGQQYVLGGNPYGTAGTDCSGLVDRVMADLGHRLPGRPLTWDLVKMGQPINYKDALPGDLVFTNYGEGGIPGPGHVGIYEGGGRMIDDPNPSSHVREEAVWETPGAVRRLLVDHLPTAVAAAAVNGSWADTVYQALKMENLPASAAGGVLRLIQSESGGDPNAQNNWDSNARAGTPSQGLMQLIPGTFAANHWPGTSGNIRDPLANIAAGIAYAVKTYGVGMLMGGGRHDGSGRYVGYDTGGLLHPGVTQVVNASGKPEAVLTNSQWQALATLASHLRQVLAGHATHHHPHHRVHVPDLHDPRRLHHPHHRVRLHHPLRPVHLHHPHRPVHLHHPLHPVRLHHTVHHAAQHLAHHVGRAAHHVAHYLHHPHHRIHLHHPVHRVRLHHPHHPIRLHHPTHKVHLHHPLHPVRLHHPHHPVRLHHPVAPPVHHHLHHAAHHPHHPLHHLVHPHHTSHHSTHHIGHHTSHRTPHQQAVSQFMQAIATTTTQVAGNLAAFVQSEQAFRDTLRGTITKGATVNDFLPHSGNAGDLRQFMTDKLASIRKFTTRIAQLKARGWPDAIIRDIAGDGLEFGVQYADMLLTSSRSDQSAIVKLSGAIESQGLASANYLTQLTSGHPGVKLPGFADGGRYPMGRAFQVGERGPETLLLDHPGTIVPNGGAVLNRSQWAGVKRLAVGADRAGLPAAMHLPATSPEARHGADLHSVVEALHRLADAGGRHGPVQHVEHQHISSGLDLEAELRKSEFRMYAGGF